MTAKPEASEEREAEGIQRYYVDRENVSPGHYGMGMDSRGEYVLYSDHAAALAKCEQREALWREYVELLAKELNLVVGLAVAHGWPGNQASYEKGVKLRAALGIEPITTAVPSPAQKGEE